MPSDVTTLIITGGAAGAFFLVLKWIVDGKLHSHSEVGGLQQDKKDLLTINSTLSSALDKSNDQLKMIIELLGGRPDGHR
jgi:hypothetical protein